MKLLYNNSYVLPVIDFCCTVLGKNKSSYKNKEYLIHKRAAKRILTRSIRLPTLDLFDNLIGLKFNHRVEYHTAIIVYKALNSMSPAYIFNMLNISNNEYHNLRSNAHKNLALRNIPHTEYLKDSFSYYSKNDRKSTLLNSSH